MEKKNGVDGKIIEKLFATKWLRNVKDQTQDFPGIPGQYFRTCACVLQKFTPACIQQKQSEGIPEFKLIDFETKSVPFSE